MQRRLGNVVCSTVAGETYKTQGVLLPKTTGEMDWVEGALAGCQNRLAYYLIYKIDNIC